MASDFKTNEIIGGIIMVISMIIAIILSNTTTWYFDLVDSPIHFLSYIFTEEQSLKSLVKEFLMIFFFISVGMELRREFQEGLLSDHSQIILPAIATIGGIVVPAFIYLAVNINHPENYAGFAIPCATDIAFAICLFNLIGKGIPPSIRIFLLSIAIFDDLGAVLIIAVFYTNNFDLLCLVISIVPIACFWFAHKFHVEHILFYILAGIILSILFYKAGISTSVAGFLIGVLWPLYKNSGKEFSKSLAPKLQPIVQFFILPIFAFTSSGMSFGIEYVSLLFHPIVVGVILGLFVGKQIGITLFSYIALRLGIATLPLQTRLVHIYEVSIFAGIGFTMSLFVGMIAFDETHTQNLVKIGVMVAFVICVLFAGLVRMVLSRR